MATSNLYFNDTLQHGRLLRGALTHLEQGVDLLNDLLACMTRMIDGDGSDASQFGEVMTRFAFTSTVNAKAAWDELNSLQAKLNTDASVDHVLSALNQAFAKFR